jgi:hypothetical protein
MLCVSFCIAVSREATVLVKHRSGSATCLFSKSYAVEIDDVSTDGTGVPSRGLSSRIRSNAATNFRNLPTALNKKFFYIRARVLQSNFDARSS